MWETSNEQLNAMFSFAALLQRLELDVCWRRSRRRGAAQPSTTITTTTVSLSSSSSAAAEVVSSSSTQPAESTNPVSIMITTTSLSENPLTTSSNSYFSCLPTEIRIEIFMRCDALTLHLNWDDASRHLPSFVLEPAPIEIWIAVLQSDYSGDISRLPLVYRDRKHRYGTRACLPDATVLCKFTMSRNMLLKIYNTGLPVPDDDFTDGYPSMRNAVHAAMRNCWFDMIDVLILSDTAKQNFAINGCHWDYFRHLMKQDPDHKLFRRLPDFLACAARNGELELIKRISDEVGGTTEAMDLAASRRHLDVVQWLHDNRTEGCSSDAMNYSARNGHLDVVKWLRENRRENEVDTAIYYARIGCHENIVEYLMSTSAL